MKRTLTVQANTRVERNIAPPLRSAITLPVLVDGRDTGVAIHVAVSAFAPASLTLEGLMVDVAVTIARAWREAGEEMGQ